MAINRIWGTSSNDLYIVGNSCKIAHYQNGTGSRYQAEQSWLSIDIYSKDGYEILLRINYLEVKGVSDIGNGHQFSVYDKFRNNK